MAILGTATLTYRANGARDPHTLCNHSAGVCDRLVCPREESRRNAGPILRVGDIVRVRSGKIRYEIVKIDSDGAFHLSAVNGQGKDGYLPPHRRDLCITNAAILKGA